MTKQKIKKIALEYLKGNRLMTLATVRSGKPWANTVFFAYDHKFNFYFFSRPETEHCQNLERNPNVAIAVNQDWGGGKGIKGFQMVGQGRVVPKNKYPKLLKFFYARHPWAKKRLDHKLYIVTPTAAYHINQRAFGHFFRVRVF